MTASPDDPHLGLVVEGPGDAKSLPVLLRNWMGVRDDYRDVLGKPVSCNGRDKAIVPLGIEGYIAVATARPGCCAVLVVLDGESDPVCEIGPQLSARAKKATQLPISVCLADRCWEDWLYASIETLEIAPDLRYSAENRGAGFIKNSLRPAKYVKPTWQPRLTARMDIPRAKSRNPSLSRMLERFDLLLAEVP
jgi:hypothetical protein